MSWFYNLRIKTRMLAGFLLIAMIAGIIGFIGITKMREITDRDTILYERMTVPISLLSTISVAFQQIRVDTRDIILAQNPEEIQEYKAQINELRAVMDQEGEAFQKLIISDEMRQAYQDFLACRKNYGAYLDQLYVLAEANRDQEAFMLLNGQASIAADAERDAINKMVEMKVQDAQKASDSNKDAANLAFQEMIIVILAGIGIAILLGIMIANSIAKPTAVLKKELDELADRGGDLTQEIKINSKCEIGDLARTVNKFLANLRKIMAEVKENSVHVAATAEQLNSSAEQTTAAVNETAATMNEISTTVEQVSNNIQEISFASLRAAEYANAGNEDIVRLTGQMQSIADSSNSSTKVIHDLSLKSQEIGRIVELITTIADQTNLLSLNAAIEAARAGEQGRGFAVVAEEVRKLADQSSNAAKQIKELINTIQFQAQNAVQTIAAGGKDVEEGILVVQDVGGSFQKIIGAVDSLTNQIQDVAAAAEEMTAGVENVAASTEEENAAMEEVSASAESLAGLAEGLNDLVGKFKV